MVKKMEKESVNEMDKEAVNEMDKEAANEIENEIEVKIDDSKCDLIHPNGVKEKKFEVIDGYTIKYHANGTTLWSKGKMMHNLPVGYWEWYRPDGTIKRSGYFENGEPVGEWSTYDNKGTKYKTTNRDKG